MLCVQLEFSTAHYRCPVSAAHANLHKSRDWEGATIKIAAVPLFSVMASGGIQEEEEEFVFNLDCDYEDFENLSSTMTSGRRTRWEPADDTEEQRRNLPEETSMEVIDDFF